MSILTLISMGKLVDPVIYSRVNNSQFIENVCKNKENYGRINSCYPTIFYQKCLMQLEPSHINYTKYEPNNYLNLKPFTSSCNISHIDSKKDERIVCMMNNHTVENCWCNESKKEKKDSYKVHECLCHPVFNQSLIIEMNPEYKDQINWCECSNFIRKTCSYKNKTSKHIRSLIDIKEVECSTHTGFFSFEGNLNCSSKIDYYLSNSNFYIQERISAFVKKERNKMNKVVLEINVPIVVIFFFILIFILIRKQYKKCRRQYIEAFFSSYECY